MSRTGLGEEAGISRNTRAVAAARSLYMPEESKALHINQTGENWEVESESSTVAQAETKQEAIEAAQEAARELKADTIVVHTSDGMVESELRVPRAPEPEEGGTPEATA